MLDVVWLAGLFIFAVIGLWCQATLLTLASTLALLASASIVVSKRWCLTGVEYSHSLSDHRASFGEEVELTIEVRNLKFLPLGWLHIADNVPPSLPIKGGILRPEQGSYRYLLTYLAMLPYERVIRRMRVRCLHRGDHIFGPAYVESGDYLGMVRSGFVMRAEERLLVMPKIFPLVVQRATTPPNLGSRRARQARLVAHPSTPIEKVLRIGTRHAGDGARLCLVTAALTAQCAEAVQACRRRGQSVRIVYIASEADSATSNPGVAFWTVPYEEQWFERDALVIRG